jgi:hypothetical protein
MSDTPTPLTLPSTLPYPIRITKIHLAPPQPVHRGTPIFDYSFTSSTTRKILSSITAASKEKEGLREYDMVGSWESGIEGEVVRLAPLLREGEILEKKHVGCVSSVLMFTKKTRELSSTNL